MEIEGNPERGVAICGNRIEGLSVAGHATCVILPGLRIAFDIGSCPPRVIAQNFIFISHAHMDHIGALPIYVATRGLYRMQPPTIIVPSIIREHVAKLFELHRAMDHSELKHTLIGLSVGSKISASLSLSLTCALLAAIIGEEFHIRADLKVKAFRTYHVIPSQGYVVYSVKQKLKKEYCGFLGEELKNMKNSGVKITDTVTVPEIAYTGDTMSDFITDDSNIDVLKAKLLIMECTFINEETTVEGAREYGHLHLSEVIKNADKFENEGILLIHFSARYCSDEIQAAVSCLRSPLAGRVRALTEGF